MKLSSLFRAIIVLVLFCTCWSSSKADTLDYWHVKYNGNVIRKYNESDYNNTIRLIRINSKKVKAADRITVNYGPDTPCNDCSTELLLETHTKKRTAIARGKGTFSPLSFSVVDVRKWGGDSFIVIYHEKGRREVLLFSIDFT